MKNIKISLDLTEKQFNDLLKLVYLGSTVIQEVSDDEALASIMSVQQLVYSASVAMKENSIIAYDKKEDEYSLVEKVEDELTDVLDEYDESRFWEMLIMRMTLRDLQKKFPQKELQEMPDDIGNKEMENIHNFYIDEFEENDIDNLKVVKMKKV